RPASRFSCVAPARALASRSGSRASFTAPHGTPMHPPRLSLAALALGIFFVRSALADPQRQLVVQLVPTARAAQVVSRARGAASLEFTGLRPLRSLAEGLPVPVSARAN